MSETVDIKTLNVILDSLVTSPEEVHINRKVDEMGVLLQVQVGTKDMGIVIGRNGVMATAIKTLMKAVGKANNMNVRIQFLEPDGTLRYNTKEGSNKTNNNNEKKTEESKKEDSPSISLDEDINDLVM
jgi:hypothetical protein